MTLMRFHGDLPKVRQQECAGRGCRDKMSRARAIGRGGGSDYQEIP